MDPDRAPRLLVVEDDESHRAALAAGLGREGFEVEVAAGAAEALRRLAARPPDLVLLDLVLPEMAGIEVCRRMRQLHPVPVIVVSALDAEAEVVAALQAGAADYVTKPYRLRELVARIHSVLRRAPPGGLPPPAGAPPGALRPLDVVVAGPLEVDFARREARTGGRLVHLSRREFDLLAMLLSPPGRVRRREELIDRLWSGMDLADTRTLDTHVRRLRLKLGLQQSEREYLITVRGVGFRFDPEGRPRPAARR